MSRIRKRLLMVGALVVVLVAAACGVFLRGEVVRVPDTLPHGFGETGFDHGILDALLDRYVDGYGNVAYSEWHARSIAEFDTYLAAVARYSPDNAPQRFRNDDEKLAYWINVYNACVIKGVLEHWPIGSVHDVKGPIEPKAGFGFFWRLRFVIGGEEINLYDLEHEIIRGRFDEPRIHFVLNCASKGCPKLQHHAYFGSLLEAQLTAATRSFMTTQVKVDRTRRTVTVSALFDWYGEDFEPSVIEWIAARHKDVEPDFEIEFADWDWSINGN